MQYNEATGAPKFGRSAGQGLVEFALVLPMLVLVVMAIIDFSWILLVYTALFSAAREGARYGAVNPRDYAGIDLRVRQAASIVSPDAISLSIGYDSGPGTGWFTDTGTVAAGNRVVVVVTSTVRALTPIIQPVVGELDLLTRAARTIHTTGSIVTTPTPAGGSP